MDLVLLDCQVELILKSLEFYSSQINKRNNFRKIPKTKEEDLEKSLIRDTYHQILFKYSNLNKKQKAI